MRRIARNKGSGKKIEIWFQDEARVGQVGRTAHVWFERGVRPRGLRDMRHAAAWIFGAVCPARDTGVALVLPEATTPGMQLLLEEISQAVAPGAHAVLILDRAGWHTARKLSWPDNVSPMHLPPYSPELNGIERVWLYLKERYLSHRIYVDADAIIDACCNAWNALIAEPGRIRSLAGLPWVIKVKT